MAQKKNEKTVADEATVSTEEVTTVAEEVSTPEVETTTELPSLKNVMLPVKAKVTVKAPELEAVTTTATIAPDFKGLKVKRLANYKGLPDIAYQTEGSAGMDLYAATPAGDEIKLPPFSRVLVPTGLSMEIPVGFEGQIRPRSGLALKQGITCLNTPGTIDADYRGEVGVILYNASNNMVRIKRGDRIAQIIFAAVARLPIQYTDELSETARGAGGFGHTGV